MPSMGASQPTQTPRLSHIDALRGVACLWVLLVHLFGGTFTVPTDVLTSSWGLIAYWGYRVIHLGGLGVNLFLVLSGFCLFFPLLRTSSLPAIRLDIRDFAVRRARRILPPYYAVLAISAATAAHLNGNTPSLADVITHATLTHNLFPSTVVSLNGPLWTLALEAQLYLLFPALVLAVRKRGVFPLLAGTFLMSVLWQLGVSRFVQPASETPASFVWYGALPARSFEFVLGMLAATVISARGKRSAHRFLWLAAPMTLFGFWWADKLIGPVPFHDQWWGVTFACWLIGLSSARAEWFRAPSLLGMLSALGVISYSVYLVHAPWIELSHSLARMALPDEGDVWIWFTIRIGVLATIILSGAWMYRWLEKPFIHPRALHTSR